MSNDTFEKLEQINAQIDVCIDEECYEEVIRALKVGNKQLEDHLKICFEYNDHCTNVKEVSKAWEQALNEKLWSRDSKDTILPIKKVYDVGLDVNVEIDWYWSRLFYGKLLRARIQQRGTDCYFRRLDDVVAYLERHLPQAGGDATKLVVIYLLELSAASQSWEIYAFADRARRVMRDYCDKVEKDFDYFYDLWARYNIGVAYFHEARYRKAVLEFNWIISEVEQLKRGKINQEQRRVFFNNRNGDRLLFLPAVIYRADIQLKLQLAYHALDTLYRYREHFGTIDYKEVKCNLIKAEAYQQMMRLDRSSECLSKVCKKLFLDGSCDRKSFPYELGNIPEIYVPKVLPSDARQSVKGRFLSIVIGHHLDYLNEVEKSWKQNRGEAAAQWINNNAAYIANLTSAFVTEYFNAVRYEAYDRRGYHEQLAEYLAWLAKVRPVEQNRDALDAIDKTTQSLYQKRGTDLLELAPLELEDKKRGWVCPYCAPKSIDLQRLGPDHYDRFCEHILKFFKAYKQYVKDKGEFINRLIRLETYNREDLRIRDLELRYESDEVLKKLREAYQFRELCWKGSTDSRGFAGLLKCVDGIDEGKGDEHLLADHYEHIIGQWNAAFLRHLEAPSSHEFQYNGFYFLGLQRWNSSSPAQGRSVGGGYLLYHTKKNGCVDMGIAIDPGFDFVSNLFHMGFSLNDIDIVLMSHAHIDHTRDFESIILLLHELQKRGKQDKRIHVILTLGIYRRLKHIIEDPTFRYFIEPYIIDINKETKPDYFEKLGNPELPGEPEFCFERIDKGHRVERGIQQYRAVLPEEELNTRMYPWVKIRPTRAYHDDRSGYSDSFGFLVEVGLSKETGDKVLFGYTGDTKWVYPEIPDLLCQVRKERIIKDITEQYDNCDVLLVHLGSLIDKDNKGEWSFDYYNQCVDKSSGEERCEELVRRKDHPYLVGMLRLLSSLCHRLEVGKGKNEPLILLSEFGEELRGGIRVDLIRRLQDTYYKRNLTLLPVDVGMNIQLWHEDSNRDKSSYKRGTNKVLCVQCNEFVPVEKADFELYGKDEALFCVCKTCCRATPHNVLQDRLRQLYEVGHELRTVRRDSI